jgi:hypothetical protein
MYSLRKFSNNYNIVKNKNIFLNYKIFFLIYYTINVFYITLFGNNHNYIYYYYNFIKNFYI